MHTKACLKVPLSHGVQLSQVLDTAYLVLFPFAVCIIHALVVVKVLTNIP